MEPSIGSSLVPHPPQVYHVKPLGRRGYEDCHVSRWVSSSRGAIAAFRSSVRSTHGSNLRDNADKVLRVSDMQCLPGSVGS